MQLSTTFRHMDASQAVREYTADKLEKIKKYFNKGPIAAHAVFAVERGFNHVADLNITLPNGIVDQRQGDDRGHVLLDRPGGGADRAAGAQVEGEDPRPQAARRAGRPPSASWSSPPRRSSRARPTPETTPPTPAIAVGGYRIIKDEQLTARSMTVEDAVMQLNLLGDEHLVFTDASAGTTSVLYRRRDGNYGLIETGASTPPAGGKPPR